MEQCAVDVVYPIRCSSELSRALRSIAHEQTLPLCHLLNTALCVLLERYKGIEAGSGLPDHLSFRELIRDHHASVEQPQASGFSLQYTNTPEGGLVGCLRYGGALLGDSSLGRLACHYESLLAAVAEDVDRSVWDIPLLTPEEHAQLACWNQTATDYPRDATVHVLFEEQAIANRDAAAVLCGRETVTYGDLNVRANRLSHYLREQGVSAGSVVGIALDRSIAMVVAMLAVLKAGACYLPLDASYPRDRLRFMLEDAGAATLLTDQRASAAFGGLAVNIVDLDRASDDIASQPGNNPTLQSAPDGLAYIMYTSGSTGTPKGAEVLHRGIVRLVRNTNYIQLDPTETIAQISKFSFDAITFEVWGALLNGGRLVILPYETILSPTLFADALRKWNVTSLFVTAALFNVIAKRAPDAFAGVRNVLVGGDVVSPESVRIVREAGAPRRLVNAYGPTECTTFSCCYEIEESGESTIPIGPPIANSEAYLLDRFRQPVPVGVLGEIYLGGDGLARGYRNRPELTEQRFVPHVCQAGARLYKTGDKGRYREDGSIEFAGRTDHQVKLRGHRIELGEIEAALRKHPEVADSVVITSPRTSGEPRLIAYVDRRSECHPNEEQLRRFLGGSLPGFMIPAQIIVLDEFPLTPEGKINRKALPTCTPATVPTAAEQPGNEIESKIAMLWSSLLGRPNVGLDDNFFDLGGSSLLLVTAQNELETRLNTMVAITDLFRFPTVRRLAQFLHAGESSGSRLNALQERARRQKQSFQNLRKQPVAS